MSVLLAGGGTAGHIEPALNLADVMRERDPALEISLLGTERGLECRLVPERGYPLELIPAVPLPRKLNKDLVAVPTRLRASIASVREVMARRNVDVVVGFGGYVAMPAYFAARRRVPMVVHEANARAGLANRIGARFTPFVAQAMDSTIPGALTLGIPLRPAIVDLDRVAQRAAGRAAFGLDPELPCLFVFGGSLGARRINDAVVAAAPAVCGAGFQILHVIGNANSDQVDAAIMPTDYHAVNYVDRMDWAYAAADLALCRAGAMTCAELAAVGLPAVYVPLPIGNGEQQLNAAPTVQAGGGEFLADSDLSGAAVAHTVIRLLDDSARLATMSLAAASRGMRESGQRLADLVGEAREAAAR